MPARRTYILPDAGVALSPAERTARGKAARTAVPRSSHATFPQRTDRPDPVALLESQAATRLPQLVPIRYGRMLASPFAFYRGAALLMADDLSHTPVSGLAVQACGDAHLSNFGAFGTPERNLVFDINDFDETTPGPWEWDLKRLATSFEIAARDRGFTDEVRRTAVQTVTASYRGAMASFATMSNLDVWYARFDLAAFLETVRASGQGKPKAIKQAEKGLAKARTRTSMQAFDKLTTEVDGKRRIASDPPLVMRLEDMANFADTEISVDDVLANLLKAYRRTLQGDRRHLLEEYQFVDLALKVVGVGSVGTRAWILLMLGRDSDDPLFLQAKEAQASVLEPYVGRSAFKSHAERVVNGQRLMQSASDIFLGWERVNGADGVPRDYYLRQLRDWKASADIATMSPEILGLYAQMCGWTLAKAHARSGDRIAIASYCGTGPTLDRAIATFAEAYADQNERDHAALAAAVDSGRIEARTGL